MIMDKFEQQFEDLDVQSQYVENAMSQTTTLSTPQDQVRIYHLMIFYFKYTHQNIIKVDGLIQLVAEENNLEISEKLGLAKPAKQTTAVVVEQEQDELSSRLAKLKSI